MSNSSIKILIILLLGLSYQPLLAQEDILRDIVKDKLPRRHEGYACYASTLRMINISNNQEFDELVTGIEKILIYKLDSASKSEKSYREISKAYMAEGYEEYAMSMGNELNMAILGKEAQKDQYVGYFVREDFSIAFYLRGKIGWEKIPKLLTTMEESDVINVFDLK
ncbi:MAG: hypothetical protein JXR10_06230 [Cyclobacteriaceae bacterium]